MLKVRLMGSLINRDGCVVCTREDVLDVELVDGLYYYEGHYLPRACCEIVK